MAASAEEERAQLTAIINYWNSVQPDLFAITLPDEVSLYWRVYLTRMYAVDASIMLVTTASVCVQLLYSDIP